MSASGPKPLIAGNWKMNGLNADLSVIDAIADGVAAAKADAMICPPVTLLQAAVSRTSGKPLSIGAQDCHVLNSGAHTGDVSAAMLKDCGAEAVIVGHSERRSDHGERDQDVRAKAAAAIGAGMSAIVCVGETIGQRQSGMAERVTLRQLENSIPEAANAANLVVAYEPVWAIGTGLTATQEDVAAMHRAIREALVSEMGGDGESVRILYGGSVKPANAVELLSTANVNGALVGGASLKAEDFLAIIAAC